MIKDTHKKLKLVLSTISSSLIPLSILFVSFVINYFSTLFSLSSDLSSNIIIGIGGISSVVFYAFLVFNDIRLFVKEGNGEFQIRSLEISNSIELTKQELERIIASKNTEAISPQNEPIIDISTKMVNTRKIAQIAITASKHIAVATNADPELTEINKRVFLEALESSQISLNNYSTIYSKENISSHRIAGIYAYWFTKLKPFSSDSLYFNEIIALKIGLAILGKTEKDISDHQQYRNMLYHLHYKNINIDTLALIFQLLESKK